MMTSKGNNTDVVVANDIECCDTASAASSFSESSSDDGTLTTPVSRHRGSHHQQPQQPQQQQPSIISSLRPSFLFSSSSSASSSSPMSPSLSPLSATTTTPTTTKGTAITPRSHHHQHYHQNDSPSIATSISSSGSSSSSRRSTSSSSRSGSHNHTTTHYRTLSFVLMGLCAVGVIVQTIKIDGIQQTLSSMTTTKPFQQTTTKVRVLPEGRDDEQQQEEQHPLGTLYVPSLDYRLRGMSQYDPDADFEAHVYCTDGHAKDLKWEWWQADNKSARSLEGVMGVTISAENNNNQNNKNHINDEHDKHTPSRRLMIGVYAGHDDYGRLLERAVYSARVYAQKWGRKVTVVTLQGTAFAPHGCKAPHQHSTLNKIRLLFHALDHRNTEYDQVLILDADSYVFDLDTDITTLLDEDTHVVAAQHMRRGKSSSGSDSNKNQLEHRPQSTQRSNVDDAEPWLIHTGVTLWNLHHPLTIPIALDWFENAKQAVVRGTYDGDAPHLHASLRKYEKARRGKVVMAQQSSQVEEEDDEENDEDQKENDGNDDEEDDTDDIHNDNINDSTKPFILNFKRGEFDFSHGKVVKQFIREDFEQRERRPSSSSSADSTSSSSSSSSTSVLLSVEELNTQRLHKMNDATKRVCARHPTECSSVQVPQYETS